MVEISGGPRKFDKPGQLTKSKYQALVPVPRAPSPVPSPPVEVYLALRAHRRRARAPAQASRAVGPPVVEMARS
jgi:hypothetical protein